MKKIISICIIALMGMFIFTGCGSNDKSTEPTEIDLNYNIDLSSYTEINDSNVGATVASIVMPATVEITANFSYSYLGYAGPFGGTQTITSSGTSQGTGFFINAEGYLMTNAHVVRLTDYEEYSSFEYVSTKYTINFADSSEMIDVSLVEYDADLDLAILKTNESIDDLKYVTFYNLTDPSSEEYKSSDAVKLLYGEKAIAIGNANGYGIAVTEGVVSAPVRYFNDGSDATLAIQTDAAINSGNSGGPLANKFGAIIGINSFKIVASNSENLGYAIPSNVVMDYIDSVSETINYYYPNAYSYDSANVISRIA